MLTADNIKDIYQLSPMQENMYFHALIDRSKASYVEQMSYRICGHLDPSIVEKSLEELFVRHDILRTVFNHEKMGEPLQIVLKTRKPNFHYEDVSQKSDIKSYVRQYKETDRSTSFNLNADVLMRISLLRTDIDAYEFVWSHHHIVLDGWCLGILMQEYFEIYQSILKKRAYKLPPVTPYRIYIEWLKKTDQVQSREYWKNYLAGYNRLAEIPGVQSTILETEKKQRRETLYFTASQTEQIVRMSRKNGITLNTIMQAVWGLLLARYNQTQDVVFGAVVSGRPADIPGIETMVGLFINTIPVRIKFGNETTFLQLVKIIQSDAGQTEPHQYTSLAVIQAESELKQNLLNHFLVFDNYPDVGTSAGSDGEADELTISELEIEEQTDYDFYLTVGTGSELTLRIDYNEKKYFPQVIANILHHFQQVLDLVIKNENINIETIKITSLPEDIASINTWNQTSHAYNLSDGLHGLFEKQVSLRPFDIAVVFEDQHMTYQQLNDAANRLANHLRNKYQVRSNDVVALMVRRSHRLIIALMGILKSGAAFLPIDPDWPKKRIEYVLNNSGARVLLVDSEFLLDLTEEYQGEIFALDFQLEELEENKDYLPTQSNADDLAYILYTSGSTGVPKGVAITMGSLSNYIQWANAYYFENQVGYAFGFFTSLAFDLTITSLFSPLLRGDKVYVYGEKPPIEILGEIFGSTANVDVVKLTPSHINLLEGLNIESSSVRSAIVGGEVLNQKQVNILRKLNPEIEIYNEYGPTEATVGCSVAKLAGNKEINIGRPIHNMLIYVMDNNLSVQPCGVAGELCIAGVGLAQGYWQNAELTNDKFVEVQLNDGMFERVYRSGDLGRWLPDGTLEYIGRKDVQVKIRGFRIEPGEIEQILVSHPDINQAAVIISDDDQEIRLTACLTSSVPLSPHALQAYLRERLPDYMVPSHYIQMESFPLNVNGKIDRKALMLLPLIAMKPEIGFAGPNDASQQQLALIWTELLKWEKVGIHDNFFDLGGHSLKAILLVSAIHKKMNVKLDLKDIFDYPTIEALALRVEAKQHTAYQIIEKARDQKHYPLSHGQKRLWIVDQQTSGNVAYNIPSAYNFSGYLDKDAFNAAFETLVNRHEILRTTFEIVDGEPMQKINPAGNKILTYIDMSQHHLSSDHVENAVRQLANKKFDLKAGPLLSVTLLQTGVNEYACVVNMHHIISDGWSLGLLMKEVTTIYNALRRREPFNLPDLVIQYKDYATWQTKQLSQQTSNAARRYWHTQFCEEQSPSFFTTDFARPENKTFHGRTISFDINEALTGELKSLCQKQEATLFMILLAALNLLLYRSSGRNYITVGTSVAGRDHPDLEGQLGYYLNALALRTKIENTNTIEDLIAKTKETAINAFTHQMYPFDQLVDELNISSDRSQNPLFEVLIVLQNLDSDQAEGLDGIETEVRNVKFESSKFDISFHFDEVDNRIQGSLTYNSTLFKLATAEGIKVKFVNSLRTLVGDFNQQIQDVSLNSSEDESIESDSFAQGMFNLE